MQEIKRCNQILSNGNQCKKYVMPNKYKNELKNKCTQHIKKAEKENERK